MKKLLVICLSVLIGNISLAQAQDKPNFDDFKPMMEKRFEKQIEQEKLITNVEPKTIDTPFYSFDIPGSFTKFHAFEKFDDSDDYNESSNVPPSIVSDSNFTQIRSPIDKKVYANILTKKKGITKRRVEDVQSGTFVIKEFGNEAEISWNKREGEKIVWYRRALKDLSIKEYMVWGITTHCRFSIELPYDEIIQLLEFDPITIDEKQGWKVTKPIQGHECTDILLPYWIVENEDVWVRYEGRNTPDVDYHPNRFELSSEVERTMKFKANLGGDHNE